MQQIRVAALRSHERLDDCEEHVGVLIEVEAIIVGGFGAGPYLGILVVPL